MTEQQKIFRVLRLISLLKGNGRTVDQLATIIESSKRTVYRYFHLLESVGFLIDKDFDGRYFIHTEDNDELAIFSAQEASVLKNLVESSGDSNLFKDSIIKKLFLQSELPPVTQDFHSAQLSKIVSQLSRALQEQSQVILKNYHSANSDTVSNRLIEPIELKSNLKTLDAFDVEKQAMRSFKLDRIGEVDVLFKEFESVEKHQKQVHDIFGVSGRLDKHVKLKLNFRAQLLLREEHPQATPFIKQSKDSSHYIFEANINDFAGIGRFVLGLVDHIEIIEPAALTEYIKKKIGTFLKN